MLSALALLWIDIRARIASAVIVERYKASQTFFCWAKFRGLV